MMLAKADVAKLRLIDNGVVTPGILVRQGFQRNQIGFSKSAAIRLAVLAADPGIDVVDEYQNILSMLTDEVRRADIFDADVVIDATASATVATAIEAHLRHYPKPRPPVVSMVLGHNADMGLMTLTIDKSVGATLDFDRRTKLAFAASNGCTKFLEGFWPTDPTGRALFQPEPGCSSPTFRGSYAEVLALSAPMTNIAAGWLREGDGSPRAFAMSLSAENIGKGEARASWHPTRSCRIVGTVMKCE